MRWVLLLWFVALWSLDGHAQEPDGILALYPPDEHCLFVPPPVWNEINPYPAGSGSALRGDRERTMRWLDRLETPRRLSMTWLAPDRGVVPEDLNVGGAGLKRVLMRIFDQYTRIWAGIRRVALDGSSSVSVDLFSAIQAACPRRVILAINAIEGGKESATVISLITGNILARRAWPNADLRIK